MASELILVAIMVGGALFGRTMAYWLPSSGKLAVCGLAVPVAGYALALRFC